MSDLLPEEAAKWLLCSLYDDHAVPQEELLIRTERHDLLRTALDEVLMPGQYRDAMWLMLDGYTETEAAQSLKLTVPQFRGYRHRAMATIREALHNPLQTRLLRAVLCDNQGYAKRAERLLTTLIENTQADAVTAANAHICMARCLDHQLRPHDALRVLDQLLAKPGLKVHLKEQFWWARHQVGIMHIQLAQYRKATQILKEVRDESGPHFLSATHQLGVIAFKQGRFPDAQAYFSEGLLGRSPRSYRRTFDLRGLALLNLKIGQRDLAMQQLTEARAIVAAHGIQRYVRKIERDLHLLHRHARLKTATSCG